MQTTVRREAYTYLQECVEEIEVVSEDVLSSDCLAVEIVEAGDAE